MIVFISMYFTSEVEWVAVSWDDTVDLQALSKKTGVFLNNRPMDQMHRQEHWRINGLLMGGVAIS